LSIFLGGNGSTPEAPTYLINQNFEGTGYDNSETWTTSVGTPEPDYTGVVLLGSQSLRSTVNGEAERARADFTGADTLYGYLLFRREGINPVGDRLFFELTINGSTTRALTLSVTSTGQLKVGDLSGSHTGTTVSTMSTGTTYHIWWSYTKGTGSNAAGTCAFSTDGTKPTSGNNFEDFTTGTSTVQGGRVWLGYTSTNSNADFIYDKVLIDDVDIGSNP